MAFKNRPTVGFQTLTYRLFFQQIKEKDLARRFNVQKHNIDVIYSKRHEQMPRRVWAYRRAGPHGIMVEWLDEIGATDLDIADLKANITLYEYSGERAIAAVTEDIGDELYVLRPTIKSAQPLAPIFCLGPFSDLELTFLEGAIWKDGVLRPYSAKGAALENLENLRRDPNRRVPWKTW